jgi:hypothetical protein
MAASIIKAIQKPFDKDILMSASNKYRINEIVKKYIEIL